MANLSAYQAGHAGPVGPQGPRRFGFGLSDVPGTHNDAQGRGPARTEAVNASPLRSYSTAAANPTAPDYASQYDAKMLEARAGIEQQFRSALEDIGKREGNAQQAVGLLPGQVQGIYDRSNTALAGYQKTLDAGQQQANLPSYATAEQQMAPLAAASGQDLAARQADVPLLKLGTTAAFDQQRSALGQARLGADADINTEERGNLAQAQQAQQAHQWALEEQQATRGNDVQDRNWLAEQDFARQQAAHDQEGRQARREEARAANVFGGADTTADRGKFLRDFNPDEYRRITHSKEYQDQEGRIGKASGGQSIWDRVTDEFTTNQFNPFHGTNRYSLDEAIKNLEKRGLYRTAAALRFRHQTQQHH